MDCAVTADHRSFNVEMDDIVPFDAVQQLIEHLRTQRRSLHINDAWLTASFEECKPLIGETRTLEQLPETKALLWLFYDRLRAHLHDVSSLPEHLSIWTAFAKVNSYKRWAGLGMPIKILESPGLTITVLLKRVEEAETEAARIEATSNPIKFDFTREFVGQGAEYLNRHILAVQSGFSYDTHYAPIVPIVQSSGSGKSKTAVELARLQLGFFTCVRSTTGSSPVSEPPADDYVTWWLHPQPGQKRLRELASESKSSSGVKMSPADKNKKLANELNAIYQRDLPRIATWLKCFAVELSQYHDEKWEEMFGEKIARPVDVSKSSGAAKWKEFKLAVAEELSHLSIGTMDDPSRRTQLLVSISTRCAGLRKDDGSGRSMSVRELENEVTRAWLKLENILPKDSTEFFHLTIDECGQMGGDHLTCLSRLFSNMEPRKSWVLLIDTTTQISRLAGQEMYSSTARRQKGLLIPCEPFTDLPMDLGMIGLQGDFDKVCSGQDRSKTYKALEDCYLPRWGRPLWNDSWLKIRAPPGLRIAGISLHDVVTKLEGYVADDERGALTAFVAQRMPLRLAGFQGVTSNRKFAETLVESHLRRLEKILPGQGAIVTNAPSEPILSLAVAWKTRQGPHGFWKRAIDAIHSGVDQFQITPGPSGEEFALIVLSAATDGAASNWGLPFNEDDTLKPIKVSCWLKALLCRLTQPNLSGDFQVMLEWAEDYVINFVHFITMDRTFETATPLKHRDLVMAYLRHAAIIGAPGQTGWDMLIPTYAGTSGGVFDARKVSYIAIQVKNEKKAETAKWRTNFATGVQPYSGADPIEHTTLLIWLDLHANKQELEIRPEHHAPPNATTRSSPNPTEQSPRKTPEQFNLYVPGHTDKVYEPLLRLVNYANDGKDGSYNWGKRITLQMGAFIGSARGHGSGRRDTSDLDQAQLEADSASFRGTVLASCVDEAGSF